MLSSQKSTACENLLFTLFNRMILSYVHSIDLTLFIRWVSSNCVIDSWNRVGNSLKKLLCISLNTYLSKYCLGLNLEILLSLWGNSSSWIVNDISRSSFMGFQPTNIPFLNPLCYTMWFIPPDLILWVPTRNRTIVGLLMDWPRFWIHDYQLPFNHKPFWIIECNTTHRLNFIVSPEMASMSVWGTWISETWDGMCFSLNDIGSTRC